MNRIVLAVAFPDNARMDLAHVWAKELRRALQEHVRAMVASGGVAAEESLIVGVPCVHLGLDVAPEQFAAGRKTITSGRNAARPRAVPGHEPRRRSAP